MATTRKKSSSRSTKKAPWKRGAPKKSKHSKLSPAKKAQAKRAAKKAGRPYPNLVDNMRAASPTRKKRKRS